MRLVFTAGLGRLTKGLKIAAAAARHTDDTADWGADLTKTAAKAADVEPSVGQRIYRVYGGDSKAGGASWSPIDPRSVRNYRDAAGLPSGGVSGATNTGQFVIEGTLDDPAAGRDERRSSRLTPQTGLITGQSRFAGSAASTRSSEMTGEIFFLSSLDSARFEPVRECRFERVLTFASGKVAVEARLSPSVVGQDFNRAADIETVILTTRHEGVSIDPVTQYPCFVFIAISSDDLRSPIRSDQLEVIGRGELYRTRDDAENHTFGLGP